MNYVLHYLDDFLTAGPPESTECQRNLESMLQLCQRINTPIKPEKVVPPTTKITFLGIVFNTTTMTASIDDDCKASILEELQLFRSSKKRKCQLLSLIGKLSFICKVVPAVRIFLHRLIDFSMTVQHLTTTYQLHWRPNVIWPGGKISFHIGLVHPLSSTHTGSPVLTCNFLLMHQAHMDGVPSGTTVGCKVDGHQPKAECLSFGKSSVLLFVLSTHGDTCGQSRRFYSTATTNQ